MQPKPYTCLLCTAPLVEEYETGLGGVTSDSKPWKHLGKFSICPYCGHVQKIRDAAWYQDIEQIYSAYSIYMTSAGEVQMMFSPSGEARPRSLIVAETLSAFLELPSHGRLLDVGCGTGEFLGHFASLHPQWELHGMDTGEHFQSRVLAVSGVKNFFTSLNAVRDKFSLIVMNDVLEHLPEPLEMLRRLAGMLSPGGYIFARSPYFINNPFDLTIADHCSHFTPESIRTLVQMAGLSMCTEPYPAFPKEVALLAHKVESLPFASCTCDRDDFASSMKAALTLNLDTLRRFANTFLNVQKEGHISGIFGSAVAGVWLATAGEGKTDFFVDESPNRQAQTILGAPVLALEDVPQNATLFLPFPPAQAGAICSRLMIERPDLRYITPFD